MIARIIAQYHFQMSYAQITQNLFDMVNKCVQSEFDALQNLKNHASTFGDFVENSAQVIVGAIVSRVAAGAMLAISAIDIMTLKVVFRSFKSLCILNEGGISYKTVSRAMTAVSLCIALSAAKIVVAAASVLAPEITLGVLHLDNFLLRMHFWWVALRINDLAAPLNVFVERGMSLARNHNLLPVDQENSLVYQHVLQQNVPNIENLQHLFEQVNDNRSGTSNLIYSPFSIKFLEKVTEVGNDLIKQKLYAKEDIEAFFGPDYVAVFNNVIFETVREIFEIHEGTLVTREGKLKITKDFIGKEIFVQLANFEVILKKYLELSKEVRDTIRWHLCCDEQKNKSKMMLPTTIKEKTALKDLIESVTNIRINLIEQVMARSDTPGSIHCKLQAVLNGLEEASV